MVGGMGSGLVSLLIGMLKGDLKSFSMLRNPKIERRL